MDFKIQLIQILCLILLSNSSNCDQTPCDIQEDFQTVAVAKARGRIGNHIWMYMKLMAKELRYGIKGENFSEQFLQCIFFRNYAQLSSIWLVFGDFYPSVLKKTMI